MFNFRELTKLIGNHPIASASAYFGCLFAGYGIVDYNRDVNGMDLKNFTRRDSKKLGEALENLHYLAFDKDADMFGKFALNSTRCEETWFLYQKALCKLAEAKEIPFVKDMSEQELQRLVARDYFFFTRRMCRRGMIRNGHVIKWLRAVILDEIFKFYVAPVVAFFIGRNLSL